MTPHLFHTRMTQVDLLRETLRKKLETTYKDIWDTPHAFQYLARWHLFSLTSSDFNFLRFEKLKNVLHIEDMELKHKRMITCFKVEMERWEVQKLKDWVKYSFAGSLNSSRGSRGCPRYPGWNPTNIFFVSNRQIMVFFSLAGTFLMLLAGSFGCDRCWLTSESSSMPSKER